MPITVPGVVPFIGGQTFGPPDQAPAAPADTSLRDAQLQALIAQHGGLVGQPAAQGKVLTTGAKAGQFQGTGFDQYTFADHSSIEMSPDGQVQNYKPATQTSAQSAAQANMIPIPGTDQVYVKDPDTGQWGLSAQSAGQLQLSNAKTVADTNYQQAQAQKDQIDNAFNSDPTNIALKQAKAQSDLNYQQAQSAKLAIDAQVSQGNLAVAQGNLGVSQGNLALNQAKLPYENQYTQAQTASQLATAQKTQQMLPYDIQASQAQAAGQLATAQKTQQMLPYDIALSQAQAQNQQASAQSALAKANEPTVWQTGTQQPYTTYYDPRTGQPQTIQNPSYLPTDPGRMTAQLQQQAQAQQQALQQQVTQGKLSADAAAGQFDQWWQSNVEPMKGTIANLQATQQATLQNLQATAAYNAQQPAYQLANFAETASQNAQKNALSLMPYVSGQGFSQAAANIAGGGKLSPQQMIQASTFSLPNLQEIGRQGAAAALAHISPTAQMHLNTPGPPTQSPTGGYPDLSSLLSQSAYGFGAQPGAQPAAQPMPVAAAGAAAPGAGMGPLQTQSIPGMNVAGMPGASPGGAQSVSLPTLYNLGAFSGAMPTYQPGIPQGDVPGLVGAWS